MTVYSIYLPPESAREEDGFRLVPDKKSFWALIAPLLWLVYHRLWLALLAYLVFVAALSIIFHWTESAVIPILSSLPGLYLLLEGQQLLSGRLERAGWRFSGIIEAASNKDAELKYLTAKQPEKQPVRAAASNTRRYAPAATANLGLFPE